MKWISIWPTMEYFCQNGIRPYDHEQTRKNDKNERKTDIWIMKKKPLWLSLIYVITTAYITISRMHIFLHINIENLIRMSICIWEWMVFVWNWIACKNMYAHDSNYSECKCLWKIQNISTQRNNAGLLKDERIRISQIVECEWKWMQLKKIQTGRHSHTQ